MYATVTTVLESLHPWGRTTEPDGDRSRAASAPPLERAAGSDAETLLRSTSAVVDAGRKDGDRGLRLEPTFRTAWNDRIEEIRETNSRLEELAARLDCERDRLALSVSSDGFVASRDRDRIGCWPSDSAFLADLAATAVLSESDPVWQTLERDERRLVLTGLRLFLERCPNCKGEPTARTNPPVGDGAGGSSVCLECSRCGSRLIAGVEDSAP
ncbi:hypothetical protein EA462_11055 [Natrarchaeobius halalkaliphilus]|uniref:DUF8054 domain-containing protein n=1 Tax=Natrarchaeobius halalkaliphilus TaxID=1679091 RepID=A0A3N6P1H2_9EURY|nr:hypothetical protein [Natrarchaeobius halalkaliphilus]RQG88925.1 hypothetical protein EA462_11055 [Natrarchaeobius halalkaliphilus]